MATTSCSALLGMELIVVVGGCYDTQLTQVCEQEEKLVKDVRVHDLARRENFGASLAPAPCLAYEEEDSEEVAGGWHLKPDSLGGN